MEEVVLVLHLLLAVGLVAAVLLQRSEGGGLGMGSGGSGGGLVGLMSGRASSDLLTRTTAFFAAGFMLTSLTLAIIAGGGKETKSILEEPVATEINSDKNDEPAAPIAR